MTNLEKVLKTDGDKFIKEIAEKICFNVYPARVKVIQPPLCGDCAFGECMSSGKWGKWKCHTEQIMEWLKAEAED